MTVNGRMHEYKENEFLILSGIQHYSFCPRQWALIHIENVWNENYLTATGRLLHERAHDANQTEKRGNTIITRGLKIASASLGISGECDVVEFHKSDEGIPLKNWEGLYQPFPIEYKRGKTKAENHDRLQLCAQAMCLEEMLCCDIKKGALFYGEPRRREQVEFGNELRQEVKDIILKMHAMFERQYTPMVKARNNCVSCSIKDICLPHLTKKKTLSVEEYFKEALN